MPLDEEYIPNPIDARVDSASLDTVLIERLAENAHEVWSRERMNEGWTYGPQRDDVKKQTPNLVPYNRLPESEREYDRRIVIGTLQAIQSLGYTIEKRSG